MERIKNNPVSHILAYTKYEEFKERLQNTNIIEVKDVIKNHKINPIMGYFKYLYKIDKDEFARNMLKLIHLYDNLSQHKWEEWREVEIRQLQNQLDAEVAKYKKNKQQKPVSVQHEKPKDLEAASEIDYQALAVKYFSNNPVVIDDYTYNLIIRPGKTSAVHRFYTQSGGRKEPNRFKNPFPRRIDNLNCYSKDDIILISLMIKIYLRDIHDFKDRRNSYSRQAEIEKLQKLVDKGLVKVIADDDKEQFKSFCDSVLKFIREKGDQK